MLTAFPGCHKRYLPRQRLLLLQIFTVSSYFSQNSTNWIQTRCSVQTKSFEQSAPTTWFTNPSQARRYLVQSLMLSRCIRMLCPNTCLSLHIVKHKITYQQCPGAIGRNWSERILLSDEWMLELFTCICSNIIYCISCIKCCKLYIGETGWRLSDRFAEHLRSVKEQWRWQACCATF